MTKSPSNTKLLREYRCADCGGRLVEKIVHEIRIEPRMSYIACGRCGQFDKFIHENEWTRRKYEAKEALDGLPDDVRQAMGYEPKSKEKPRLIKLSGPEGEI